MSRPRIPLVALAHPFELALAVLLLVNAGRALFGDVTPSLAPLSTGQQIIYFLVSALGGCGVLVGLVLAKEDAPQPVRAPVPRGVALERASLFVVAGAYLALGAAVVGNNPGRGAGYALVAAVVGLACLLRAVAIRRRSKAVIAGLQQLRHDQDAADAGR